MMGIDPDKHRAEIKRRGNIFKRIYLAIKNRRARKKRKNLQDSLQEQETSLPNPHELGDIL